MTFEWAEKSLGDLIEIKHGFAFKGEFFRDEPPGDVLLTPGNFSIGGGFKADKLKYYIGPVSGNFVLREGDLIITMTDLSKNADTLGFPAIIPKTRGGSRYLHNQRLGKIIPKDKDAVDLRYLYYLLGSKEYRHEVVASATGTTVKHTSPERIKRFRFWLPPPSEQRAIAHILGTLDDKIELNRRISETLEAMARALFKSWFVDFDPVRAMAEGRWKRGQSFSGFPANLYHLFPGSFVDSELGKIPEGWAVQPFSDTVEIIGGGTPKTSEAKYWGGEIPWFSVVDAPVRSNVWVVDTEKKITRDGLEHSAAKLMPVGTTIITARGTVGRIALIGVPMAINQSCYGLRGKAGGQGFYNYFSTHELVAILQQQAHGSVFDTITRDTLAGVAVAVPPGEIINAFEVIIGPSLHRIRNCILESYTLADLRDTLLPKLISGKMRLKDAGNTIAEAGI